MERLGAGLTIETRAATDALSDIEQIVALQCARNGDDCDLPVRELLARPGVGPERFAVAVDDGRIVSSLCLIPETLRLGDATFGAGQIEFVATAESHGRRGLVRALMARAHAWSAEDGHLVQLIAGIRYFYRRFGYEYAVPFHRVWIVDDAPTMPAGWTVRRAVPSDAEALRMLQDTALDGVALTVRGDDVDGWRRRLGSDVPAHWWVAVDASGAVGGTATIGDGPPGVDDVTLLGAPAIAPGHGAAIDALLAAAGDTHPGRPAVQQRRAVDALLDGRASLHPRQYSLYVRAPDPVALLDALRPVLTERLRASPFAGASGRLPVSFYERSVVLTYEGGAVTSVEAAPGEQSPAGAGGIGIPPDLVATLLFGKHGAIGLAERHEDVDLGAHTALAEVLFPQLERDIALI